MYSKLKTSISLSSYKHSLKEYIVANGFLLYKIQNCPWLEFFSHSWVH